MGQNVLDTDVFGGTAGTALPTYDANWVNAPLSNLWNNLVISTPNGGVVAGVSFCAAYRTGQTWTNDQFAQATIVALPSTLEMLVGVRMLGDGSNNPSSGYFVGPNDNISGNAYRVFSVAGGLNTPLATSSTVAAVNDVVNLQVVGTTITVRVNGVLISDLTCTDSNHTTGNPGLFINDPLSKWTTWSAGSVTSSGAAPITGSLLMMFS
jgi:hypothetical protein